MKLAAERRGLQADEEQLSWPARGPGVCDWQGDAEEELDRRVSGEGTNRPEWFQIRFFGFLLLAASTAAGSRWVHSTRIKDCIIAHGVPCTMNLQRNAIKSVAASTKWKKTSASPFDPLFVCHYAPWFRPVWCITHRTEVCGSELAKKSKESVGMWCGTGLC